MKRSTYEPKPVFCRSIQQAQSGFIHGRSQNFSKGGHTESYRGYSQDCHLNIVGCLLTKRLTKEGGLRAPRTPLATPLLFTPSDAEKQTSINFTSRLPDLPDFSRFFFSFLSFFSFRRFSIAKTGRSAVSSDKRLSRKQ